jgi:4-hydroxy-tetrahydrodipicolinate reductase
MQDLNLKKSISIIGASGKLGQETINTLFSNNEYALCQLISKKSRGQKDPLTQISYSSIEQMQKVDLVIEIASSQATLDALKFCAQHQIPLIIGSTGHAPHFKQTLIDYSKHFPIFFCENFSVPCALTLNLLKMMKNQLTQDCYIDIIEKHRAQKKDAPSGTAKKIVEVLNRPYETFLSQDPRDCQQIQIHSIRANDHAIEHEIIFSFNHEQISIKHQVFSRKAYSEGLMKIIPFIFSQNKGLFDMSDLLRNYLL